MTASEKLNLLMQETCNCTNCRLSTTRTKLVFGEGCAQASIMFIGEGPGREEDIQGIPFVGRAGKLLTAIIEKGMGLSRSQVYIANLVKCRPTVNLEFQKDRPPDADELAACEWILREQINIIKPKVIVALGSPSTKYLLKTKIGITKMRGQVGSFNNIPVVPTFHPSYVIRNGGMQSPLKKEVWVDIQKAMAIAGITRPTKSTDNAIHP